MKFSIEKLTKSSGRLGQLVHSETGKQFRTPLLLQTTKGGSIPHLSREVFDYVSKETHVLQMTLSTMDTMADTLPLYNGSLAAFVGYKDYPTVLTIRDPCELMPQGWNERDVVPLYTRRGKEPLSAERYMEMVENFSPDIYQGLSDADTNVESAKKRIKKSVDRTEKFMDYCYARQATSTKLTKSTLFAPIVGGYNTFARTDSIKHAKDKGGNTHGGYSLEGFHNFGLTATALNTEHLSSIVTHCINELEQEKPRLMSGAYTPLSTLELICLGIDIFDSSYAYLAAANFKALTFNFDLTACKSTMPNEEVPFLDLTDEKLREDFTPFIRDCSCLACSKHTRAYVHHLYKTKELLGPILLMVHNLHHYIHFFETIRKSIEADKLPELIQLIKTQNTDKTINYRIFENTKVIPKTGMGKGFVPAAKVDGAS